MRRRSKFQNPTYPLFQVLAVISLGGIVTFLLADRIALVKVFNGDDLYAINLAIIFVPILLSSAGAFLMFRAGFAALERQISDRENAQRIYMEEIEHSYRSAMSALVAALDSRDHMSGGHSRRVVAYAIAIADCLGVAKDKQRDLVFGGYLHDVGKIGVNDSLLLKDSKLSDIEWAEMKKHPLIGRNILQNVDFLGEAADIVLYHHERYDGQGYPTGLAGEEIPLLARIFAVADAFDAMTADRPYRKAVSFDQARNIISKESGKQFCPRCVQYFLGLTNEQLQKIKHSAELTDDTDVSFDFPLNF